MHGTFGSQAPRPSNFAQSLTVKNGHATTVSSICASSVHNWCIHRNWQINPSRYVTCRHTRDRKVSYEATERLIAAYVYFQREDAAE